MAESKKARAARLRDEIAAVNHQQRQAWLAKHPEGVNPDGPLLGVSPRYLSPKQDEGEK